MYLVTVGSYDEQDAVSVHFSKERAIEEAKSLFTGPHEAPRILSDYTWYAEGPLKGYVHGFVAVASVKVRW